MNTKVINNKNFKIITLQNLKDEYKNDELKNINIDICLSHYRDDIINEQVNININDILENNNKYITEIYITNNDNINNNINDDNLFWAFSSNNNTTPYGFEKLNYSKNILPNNIILPLFEMKYTPLYLMIVNVKQIEHIKLHIKYYEPHDLIHDATNSTTGYSLYIEKTQEDFKIEWNNLYFIWKEFLSNNNLPNVIFMSSLKTVLKTLIPFDEKTDTFIGITSKHLPVCKDFMQFLRETISISKTVDYTLRKPTDFTDELEIDEINTLFRQWSKNKYNLTEENILKILEYFCSLKIVNNKYILDVISTAWNKRNHINDALPFIKNELKTNYKLLLISFDDLYNYYNKFYNCGNNETKLIVSKRYFENYLTYKYPNFILYFLNIPNCVIT
jgi:hypothetical protein